LRPPRFRGRPGGSAGPHGFGDAPVALPHGFCAFETTLSMSRGATCRR
jgi:hypothetical protein